MSEYFFFFIPGTYIVFVLPLANYCPWKSMRESERERKLIVYSMRESERERKPIAYSMRESERERKPISLV